MAVGDVATCDSKAKKAVCLLDGATATNGQPSAATDGVPVYPTNKIIADDGVCYSTVPAEESSVMVKAVGTAGTVTVTLRLWGYLAALGEWVPVGAGADATKGTLNAGNAIGESKTDKALHAERVLGLSHFDRLYLEITTIGGTDTAVTAYIVTPRPV